MAKPNRLLSKATWRVGHSVKIRSVTVREAERIQHEGPRGASSRNAGAGGANVDQQRQFSGTKDQHFLTGWDTSMEGQLGEIKEIQQLRAHSCQLTGGLWWMFGLLETPGTRPAEAAGTGIRVGSRVRVRDGVSPRYGWGGVQGEQGHVVQIEDDGDVRVRFASHPRWHGELSELVLCEGEDSPQPQASAASDIRVGALVRVRASVSSPRYNWGSVSPGEQGRVVVVEADGDVRIDFPSQSGWCLYLHRKRMG